jgi:hypothetical protein
MWNAFDTVATFLVRNVAHSVGRIYAAAGQGFRAGRYTEDNS